METMIWRRCAFIIFIWGLMFGVTGLHAQDSLWSSVYGGYYNESGNSAVRLDNGDFLLLGSTYSYGSGDYDIYLVKVDSTGTKIWTRTYGGSGTDYGCDITPTSDGGFIIVGSTTSYGAGGHDLYLIKIDDVGTVVWSKTYGGTADDRGASVRMSADSGFIVCGTTASFGTGTDIYLIKTDSLGDSTWTRTYGGSGGESGSAVRVAIDSGYILLGSTGSYGAGYSSFYLVRTGATGDTLWTATYGGARADFGYGLETTNDKGYILTGATAPDGASFYDAYLVKTDSLGVEEWSDNYGGSDEDRTYAIAQTADGGYILTGSTEATGGRKIDLYMVKTDAGGALEWDGAYGGSESDYGRTVLLDADENYYVLGYSFSTGSGGSDIYLLKIEGPAATPVDDFYSPLPTSHYALSQNYPNPFNLETIIEFTIPRRSSYRLTIYNILGQAVRRWEDDAVSAGLYALSWDGRNTDGRTVASGIYFYTLQAGTFCQSKKMILMK